MLRIKMVLVSQFLSTALCYLIAYEHPLVEGRREKIRY